MPPNSWYFQTLRYPLGDSQVLCWSERNAYIPHIKPNDTAPIHLPSQKDHGQTSPKAPAIFLGETIQPEQLMELRSFRKSTQGQQSSALKKRSHVASLKAWLAGDFNVFSGIIDADDERWTRSTMQSLRTGAPSGWPQREAHLQQLLTLLHRIKAALKTSEHGVCVATKDNRQQGGVPERGNTLDIWEPEFDVKRLDEQQAPPHLRVPKQHFSDEFVQKFWIDNKSKDSSLKRC